MQTKGLITAILVALMIFTLPTINGCGAGGSALPSSVDVDLPDGTTTTAPVGSGPSSLANTEWALFRLGATTQGAQFVRLVFDEDGGIIEIDGGHP